MTTWGFIGSGTVGSTVARLATAAGHDVVLSNSRGPETLDLGPLAGGWRTQPGQPAHGLQYAKDEADRTAGYRAVGSDELAGRAVRATREA